MTTSKPSVERLLYFTDAMVAIAATLLVLPLVDEASQYFGDDPNAATAAGFLAKAGPNLLAFAISFAVIARLWVAHHRLFSPVRAVDGWLVALDLLWAFTLVFLPLPTQITALYTTDRAAVALYAGTMFVSSLLLFGVVVHLRRSPALTPVRPPIAPAVATSSLFGLSLVIGVALSSYLPLLLLLLGGVATRVLSHRLDRDDAADPDDAPD